MFNLDPWEEHHAQNVYHDRRHTAEILDIMLFPEKAEEEKDGEDGGSGVPAASSQSSAGDQQSEGDSGRIIFKRPAKRRRSSEGVLDASTKKTGGEAPASRGPGSKNKSPKTRKRSGSSSGVKNSSLLSFGDEEEEDNWYTILCFIHTLHFYLHSTLFFFPHYFRHNKKHCVVYD